MRSHIEDLLWSSPDGTRVEFKEPKRTLPQNAKMWAMLTDVAREMPWEGRQLSTNDWKLLFLDALKRESKLVLALDGGGFVNLKQNSSDLTKDEMSQLIELIYAWGAKNFIEWSDENG